MFMKSMKPGHLNWIECLGPARQPVEEAAGSLSPPPLYFFFVLWSRLKVVLLSEANKDK